MQDIETFTNEELIAELFRRHDAMLVVRMRRITPSEDETVHDFHGGLNTALGLAVRIQDVLLRRAAERRENIT